MEFLTLNKIKEILAEEEIKIRKRLGQNFLIDRNCRDKILSFADLKEDDIVVEVGPGLGCLTEILVEKTKEVYAFEVDRGFCSILQERFQGYPNFHLIPEDFLASPDQWWNSLPEQVKVISNTPYRLSSRIATFILTRRKKINLALLTVQKEVAERLTAVSGSKNYAPASVLFSIYTKSRICYALSKSVFYPRPEVNSVVIKIVPQSRPIFCLKDENEFQKFLPLIFSHRRKKLSNVVEKNFGISKEKTEREFQRQGLSNLTRIEQLEPEEIYRVFEIVKAAYGK